MFLSSEMFNSSDVKHAKLTQEISVLAQLTWHRSLFISRSQPNSQTLHVSFKLNVDCSKGCCFMGNWDTSEVQHDE